MATDAHGCTRIMEIMRIPIDSRASRFVDVARNDSSAPAGAFYFYVSYPTTAPRGLVVGYIPGAAAAAEATSRD